MKLLNIKAHIKNAIVKAVSIEHPLPISEQELYYL